MLHTHIVPLHSPSCCWPSPLKGHRAPISQAQRPHTARHVQASLRSIDLVRAAHGESGADTEPATTTTNANYSRRALGLSSALLLGRTHIAAASGGGEEPQNNAEQSSQGEEPGVDAAQPSSNDRVNSGSSASTSAPDQPLPLVPRASLRSGEKRRRPLQVSRIIKGCWQLDGEHKGNPKTDRTSGSPAMSDFERFNIAGITTVDTADIYGPSESQIGQYLRLYPWRRDSMQLCTKVTVMEEDAPQLTKDLLEYRVRRSMARLGVSSLDLVQLHWENFEQQGAEVRTPGGSRKKVPTAVDAAQWLAELQGRGLVKAVGLTNFDVPHMLQVLDAGVDIASHQVQYSVLDRRPELYMLDLCKKRSIPLIAYGTLSGGWLSSQWARKPARKAALDTMSKAKYGPQLQEMGGWPWLQEVLAALSKVGKKHGVSPSAVAIAWVLQQPSVAAASVGARNAAHVRDLQTVFIFTLDEDDLLMIDAAYEGATKQPTSDIFAWERGASW